jgi:acyl-CoA thioester hydrolase
MLPSAQMTRTPLVFTTTHRVQFSELDPYNHVGTGRFAVYYVDHRMQGLSQRIGWDVATLATLPFAVWVRRLEIDFIRPVLADQDITITSFVREFRGSDAFIECTMADAAGNPLSRAVMVVACVDKTTSRGTDWPEGATALFYEPDRP